MISDCPGDIATTTELGTTGKVVTWTEPDATDRSGTPRETASHQPGFEFPVGTTNVLYTFADNANNVATCSFSVTVGTGNKLLETFGTFENDYISRNVSNLFHVIALSCI